jgi:hypothetical protein
LEKVVDPHRSESCHSSASPSWGIFNPASSGAESKHDSFVSRLMVQLGRFFIVILSFCVTCSVSALCLDPKTSLSGYQIPLQEEVQVTKNIAIGTLTKVQPLYEDPDDPHGITAYLRTVKLSRQLKGNLPKVIRIRDENGSGRYLMEVGEQHLFFISRVGKNLGVNSCGNSANLTETLLQQVKAQLSSESNAP